MRVYLCRSNPFTRNEGRSSKTEEKLRFYLSRSNPFARNEGRSSKTEEKLRFFVCWSNPIARNEGRSSKTEEKLRVYLCRSNPFARNEGRSSKTEEKLRFYLSRSNPFARNEGRSSKTEVKLRFSCAGPYKIINDTGQQAFLDARQADEVEVVPADEVEVVREDNVDSALPPVPEEGDDEWEIRPGFLEEDEEEEDTGPMEEDIFPPPERRVERPRPEDGGHERNVRPRVEARPQPESERGSSLAPSRRDSLVPGSASSAFVPGTMQAPSSASSWPSRRDLLNDLPDQLRVHLERARVRDSERSPEEQQEARAVLGKLLRALVVCLEISKQTAKVHLLFR